MQEGWSRDWTSVSNKKLMALTFDEIKELTLEDRFYLLFRPFTVDQYNRVAVVYSFVVNTGTDLESYKEVSDHKWRVRVLKKLCENQVDVSYVFMLITSMLYEDLLTSKQIQTHLDRRAIDKVVGMIFGTSTSTKNYKKALNCYKDIQLEDFKRLFEYDDLDEDAVEFLKDEQKKLERKLLRKRAKEALQDKPKIEAL